jgi:uncharacterized membrane-anchored protein
VKASRRWLLALAVTAAAQIGVPAYMIAGRERVLHAGDVFRFRTGAVDPYDAFKGRYVALRFEQDRAKVPAGTTIESGQQVYVQIETGHDDFAELGLAQVDPPSGRPYLKLRASSRSGDTVYLTLPFDRFYMSEDLAPQAERAYREHGSGASRDAYVTVRVRDGVGVIENLYVGGKPIADLLREAAP